MRERNFRNVLFISISQFWTVFCFNFVLVFLPFLVRDISPYSSTESLIWVGLIMGAPSFLAALFSTFWGSLTSRFKPKSLYMRGLACHVIIVFSMGFATSLPTLLLLRIIQGMLGGISTLGLIIVSSSSTDDHSSRDIGFFQNSLTLGQLLGPPAGAIAASTLGYRGAFLTSSAFILLTLIFCQRYVINVPREKKESHGATLAMSRIDKRTLIGWGLCFVSTVQLMFLPSVLPDVFEQFNVERSEAIRLAGFVVMLYTGTAFVGTYLFCRLASIIKRRKLIIFVGIVGVVFQLFLCLPNGVATFLSIRMIQTGAIAATLPLIFSFFASDADGKVMGFLNSARFAGNALGPMIATFVLASSNMGFLYVSISGLSLLALLGFIRHFRGEEEPAWQS